MYGVDWESPGFRMISPDQQSLVRLSLKLWDDLIPQNLVETTAYSSNIEFAYSSTMSGYAHAYLPSDGSVWFSLVERQDANNSITSPTIGRYGFKTVLHEIGHALGLNHMGDYVSSVRDRPSSFQDSTVFSIMSYYGPGGSRQSPDVAQANWTGADGVDYSSQTPMLNDVMAIQSIYGVSKTTRTGDTVYGFGSNIADSSVAVFDFTVNRHPILTIFDSGGIDTLDLSGWRTSSVIRLKSGAYSSCNGMTDNIAIAYTCVIENATAGSGDDQITGNSADNVLKGNAGDDLIDGGTGDDTLFGGAGNDHLSGGGGTDVAVFAGAFSSYVASYSQVDYAWRLVSAAEGNDVVVGVEFFQFSDGLRDASLNLVRDMQAPLPVTGQKLNGNAAANILLGQGGPDTLTGMAGNDVLAGMGGDDRLDGGAGLDTAAYGLTRASYTVSRTAGGLSVNGPEGQNSLSNIERLHFADVTLAFDTDASAGQIYRLYQAAFNRMPDSAGLGSWISAMDQGMALPQVASGFMQSAEFQGLYGANPDNGQFVTLLYDNVLHRTPDAGGYGYWVDQLTSDAQTREQVLTGFSESAENKAALQPVMENGIAFTERYHFTGSALADVLIGSAGDDLMQGLAGNDVFISLGGADSIDGGAGIDTAVFVGIRASHSISHAASALMVSDAADVHGTDRLSSVERLQFGDVNLAFDVDGNAGQTYRLYQAAFDRAPDLAGLGSWIAAMDQGLALTQVASGFIQSAEFQILYGASPGNGQFVTLLYDNVLHRAPDAGGYGYWVDQLASNAQTREQVLTGFSESPEHQLALIGVIQDGMAYLPG